MHESEKNMANFRELTSGETPVLVDFYATWCGPCKMMHPVLEELKEKMGDGLKIIKLDIENRANIKVVQQYRVRSVPTLMLFKEGKLLWHEAGARSTFELEQVIRQHVNI